MPWNGPEDRKRKQLWILCIFAVLAAGLIVSWPRIKRGYGRWMAKRQLGRAEVRLAAGDYKRAILDARSVLDADTMNIRAIRILAKALDAIESPAAGSWWSRLDSLQPGDPETAIAWASNSIRAGDVAAGERTLQAVKPADQESAGFHSAAAKMAAAKHDLVAAEKHWAEACHLRPGDDGYRLALATLQLDSIDPDKRLGAIEILTELSRTNNGLAALRALLGDAARRKEWERATGAADALIAAPGATFADKLGRLEVLRAMKSPAAAECLLELKNTSVANPDNLYLLLMWMNRNDLALMVCEWALTLPPETISTPPVAVAVAEAYSKVSEWKRLREFLTRGLWADSDYLRRGFLARALDRLDESDAAAQEWKEAIATASSRRDSIPCLERLARAAISWSWPQRAEEVMWGMTASPDCPRWVLEGLWNLCLYRSETPQLQKLSSILRHADSKSVEFQNNFAFYTLLTHTDEGDPHRDAEKLSAQNPGNASIAITRGLSLYQQGKVTEAVALMASLKAEQLREPQVALYHAILLTAAGDAAKAAEYLPLAKDWKMFPEEKALLDRVKAAAAKAAAEAAQPRGVPR